jgi:hypothetical protein
MSKLMLDVDALRVDRFDVEPETVAGEGTVLGNQIGTFNSCGPNTCYPQESCVTGSPCRKCVGFVEE